MHNSQLSLPGLFEPELPAPPADATSASALLWVLTRIEGGLSSSTLAARCELSVRTAASELAWLRSRGLVSSRSVQVYRQRRELWTATPLGREAARCPVLGARAATTMLALSTGARSTSQLVDATESSASAVLHGVAELHEQGLAQAVPGAGGRRKSIWGGSERVWELTESGMAATRLLPAALAEGLPGAPETRHTLFET